MAHGIPRNKNKMYPGQRHENACGKHLKTKKSYIRNPYRDWRTEDIYRYDNNEIS